MRRQLAVWDDARALAACEAAAALLALSREGGHSPQVASFVEAVRQSYPHFAVYAGSDGCTRGRVAVVCLSDGARSNPHRKLRTWAKQRGLVTYDLSDRCLYWPAGTHCRLSLANGARHIRPPEAVLQRELARLEDRRGKHFMFIDHGRPQHFLQISRRSNGGWLLEARDGNLGRHYECIETLSVQQITELVGDYAAQQRTWQRARWVKVAPGYESSTQPGLDPGTPWWHAG